MPGQNRPNLFQYATSELSQDAFICWLAAWADPKFQAADPHLHQTARDFVVSMIRKVKQDYDSVNIETVEVRPQVQKLDVLIEVNKNTAEKLAILVEDKTHTSNHSDQLNRYHEQVRVAGYTVNQMIPLYFKTGYQSKFDTLGFFKIYLRRDFLNVLKNGKANGVRNAIYDDFLQHLEGMELAVNQFLTKNLTVTDGDFAWNDYDRRGLFMRLYEQFSEKDDKADWGYVANASGGFFGFWWNFEVSAQGDYWSYLQLEGDKLCYKIGFSDEFCKAANWKVEAEKIRSTWSSILIELDMGLTDRATRIGKTMTIAKKADGSKYLLSKAEGTLDLDKTITRLLEAQTILKEAYQLVAISEQ